MRVIVSDTSCIIDLKTGNILASLFDLPYRFVIPEPLFESELLSLSSSEKQLLRALGLESLELNSDQVSLAFDHRARKSSLSSYDCFALSLAQSTDNAILMTGDANLRIRSESLDIETHGVIWALDQQLEHQCCSSGQAVSTLQIWLDHPLVFLPKDELIRRITRLS